MEIISIDENTWRIEDGEVRFFLLTGTREALLIDSGMMVRNAREIAQSLTKLPVKLLNTHADIDHVGSNAEFDSFYMSPAEASNYYNTQKQRGTFIPVWDGDIIDLGERPLEIIELPGHTPGSIAVLDRQKGVLFSGDPIQDGNIFMFGVQRELHAYQHSLRKLQRCRERFHLIYPAHGTFPISTDIIPALIEGVDRILAGEITPEEASFHGIPILRYDVGVAGFLLDKKD